MNFKPENFQMVLNNPMNMNMMNNQNNNMMNFQNMQNMNFPNQSFNNMSNQNNFNMSNQFVNFSGGTTNNIQPVNMIPNNFNMMNNNFGVMNNNINNFNMMQNNINMLFNIFNNMPNNFNMMNNNFIPNNLNMLNNNFNMENNMMMNNNFNMNCFPNIMDNQVNPLNINKNNEEQNFQLIHEINNPEKKQEHKDKKQNNDLKNKNPIEKKKNLEQKKKNKIIKKKDLNANNSRIILGNSKNLFDYKEYIKVSKEKKKDELEFKDIKNELEVIVENIIKKFLENKQYESNQAQLWCNSLSDEIIKIMHQQQRGFKFICTATIFQKAGSSLNFSSTCLWSPSKDGSITVKYENDTLHCFVCLYGVS